MKKIINSSSLIVLLLLIVASCIARSVKNQMNNNDRFRHLTGKYSTINMGCEGVVGNIYMSKSYLCPALSLFVWQDHL